MKYSRSLSNGTGEKGATLFIALGVIVIMSFLGVAFMKLSVTETQDVTEKSLAQEAFYIAETGAQMALREIELNGDWTGVSYVTYGSGQYTVTVTPPDANQIQTITSTGKIKDITRKVEVKVKKSNDIPEALFYCQFGNDRVTMHADDPNIFGMRVYGNTWSNRSLRLDEGSRHWGDISANDVRNGDISEGWSPKMTAHDSSIIYGDVVGADIDNQSWGSIRARSAMPLYDLDAANGDATTKDAYWRDTLGNCTFVENSAPVVNTGYIQGSISEITTGVCPGNSTFSTIPYPLINYDTLKDIASAEGHYFATNALLYSYLRTSPNWDTSGSDTIRKMYGKVFYVDDINKVDFDANFNKRNNFDIRACFYTKGGLYVVGRKYTHIAPDSFPAIVTHGDFFMAWQTSACSPPCPVYIEGLIYTDADDLDNPYDAGQGQVHLHHDIQADSIVVKGAILANYAHDCVKLTIMYDPKVQKTAWLFNGGSASSGVPQVVSWRQLKRG